jgi:HTH-type transcriptional regulator/antitoxin HigA
MIKLIKTAADHAIAKGRIGELMAADPPEGTAEANELEVLAHLVESYEKQAFNLGLPDPVEAIKFRMEQQGLTRQDLVPFLGSPSRVSEVLARKRPVNLAMARRLHEGLGIPAEVFLRGGGHLRRGMGGLSPEERLVGKECPSGRPALACACRHRRRPAAT